MPTYANFTALVRDWSNKDSSVLSDTRIQDCMRYAADKCYRNLRVVALEQTVTYTSTALTSATTSGNGYAPSKTELTLPADLIEFIQIREIDADGRTCRVFNEKTDLRTYNDWYAEKYDYMAYWSRVGNTLLLSPGFNKGSGIGTPDRVELHYYKRLPALNAKYAVVPANFTAGFLTQDAAGTRLYFVDGNTQTAYTTQAKAEEAISLGADKVTAQVVSITNNNKDITIDNVSDASNLNAGMTLSGNNVTLNSGAQPVIDSIVSTSPTVKVRMATGKPSLLTNTELVFANTNSNTYVGNETYHWLRDENERVLLMGALAEAFAYLQDDDQAAKYKQLFNEEILELNNEDAQRNASGGNVQVTFNGRGLI